MRVYNATSSALDLPLTGVQRITVEPKSVSGDIMPSKEFLALMTTSFTYDEIALIVSGPFEIAMCSEVSGSVGFVVQSLDEAIERFNPNKPEHIMDQTGNIEEEKASEIKIIGTSEDNSNEQSKEENEKQEDLEKEAAPSVQEKKKPGKK